MAWPDGGTNEVTTKIGTAGAPTRDHESIAAWEADTDDNCVTGWGAGDYADPCSPVGECYDDGDLEYYYLYGATTDSTHYRTLTVAVGQRHDGTAYGGGVTSASNTAYARLQRDLYSVVEWLICTGSGSPAVCIAYYTPADSFGVARFIVCATTGDIGFFRDNMGAGGVVWAQNCIVHSGSEYAFRLMTLVDNCTALGNANTAYLVQGCVCHNTISIGGTTACFHDSSGTNNISGDTTDAGADTINSVASTIFLNVGAGTEDLHLDSEDVEFEHADDAGADLSAYFTIDIDGQTRVDWDIGADEFISGAPTGIPAHSDYYFRMRGQ